jgi:hypothetical protein
MAKIISYLLRILFVITIVAGIYYYPVEKLLFTKEFYTRIFEEENIYQKMTTFSLNVLMDKVGDLSALFGTTGSGMESAFDQTAIREFLQSMISEEWVKEQVDAATGAIIQYLNNNDNDLNMLVDLTTIKGSFTGEFGRSFIETSINKLPDCKLSDLVQFGMQMFSGGSSKLPLCKPPEQFMSIVYSLMDGIIGQVIDPIPDTINLAEFIRTEDLPLQNGVWSHVYNYGRGFIKNSLIILPILVVFLVFIHWKEKSGILSVIGLPTLIAGCLGGGIALWIYLFSGSLAENFLQDIIPVNIYDDLSFLADVISRALKDFSTSALFFSGIAIGIGILLLVIYNALISQKRTSMAPEIT